MKLNRALVLLGLLSGFAPSISFAGCTPACASGQTCRYESAGNYFYCSGSSIKSVRPRAEVSAQPGGTASRNGGNLARSATPRKREPVAHKDQIIIESVKSPRDAQSGRSNTKGNTKP